MKEFVISVFKEYRTPIKSHKELKNLDFDNRGKIHDWRNYINDFYVKNWDSLTYREKAIIYCEAEKQADAEEWD